MKARIPIVNKTTDKILMSYDDVKKAVEEEFNKKQYEIYTTAVQDITVQVLSNVFMTLELCYGWKQQRILKLIENLHSYEDDMVKYGITTTDNYKHFIDKYGIDLVEEFPAHIRQHKKGETDEEFLHFTNFTQGDT